MVVSLATTKETQPTKLTAAQLKKKVETQEEKIKSLKEGAWCYMCDTHKARDKFYMSTDPMSKSGLTPICKDCARKIALKVDNKNIEHEPDKESVKLALKYLNKPYLDRIWDSSMQEMENLASGRVKSNIWVAYIRQISMGQYNGMTYFDSDFYKVKTNISENSSDNSSVENEDSSDEEIMSAYEQNKKDAIRLLGYDPFSKESTAEQPFLYATLQVLSFVHINIMKNKVWYYRNQRGFTLQELSRLTGLSVAAINKIENDNTSDILLTNAITLSRVLKVDIYELFCISK